MTMNEAIGRVLDETIEAFIMMDSAKLERLEEQIVVLAQSDLVWTEDGKQKVLDKKRVLEVVLQTGESNLLVCTRLRDRNMGYQWVR
jgi:hypothetical protein